MVKVMVRVQGHGEIHRRKTHFRLWIYTRRDKGIVCWAAEKQAWIGNCK